MKKFIFVFLSILIAFNTLLHAEIPTRGNVTRLYVATFNRAPDSAGLNYWLNNSGLQLEQIAQSFFDQPETQTLYPLGTPDRNFIQSVYGNLFNRSPESAGWNYWEQELSSGRIHKSVFILAVINGAQGTDAIILENKTEVGMAYADAGLNNAQWAKEVMSNVTADLQSVDEAIIVINGFTNNTTCINNYYQKNSPETGFALCVEDVDQQFCERITEPDETYGVNAIMIPFSCIGAGFPADSQDESSNIYFEYELFKGIEYAYQTGDIADDTYLSDIRQSLAVTSGALVQAMLSINTFIFTNNATTSLDTFKERKTQVDQALNILETKAAITDGYLDMLSSPEEAQSYITANYKTIEPAEVEAILNSSKMKGVLRPLMAHYHVSARKAKEILDNAMDHLYTQYTEEADNYETATNVAKVVRDGAALAITIGATVATAGTVGGLGVVGGISSLVQGADGIVKLSKSSAELIIGKDGALDDTYKHSGFVGGLSAASEMLAIKSLFTKPDTVAGVISNMVYWSSKAREVTQDEVIAFGPASLNYGDYIHYKANKETYRKLLSNIYSGAFAYPTKGTYRSGTKVLVVDKKALQELVKKLLKVLPEDSQVQGTKDTLEDDNMGGWPNWPNPEACPMVYDPSVFSGRLLIISRFSDGFYKDYAECSYYTNNTLEAERLSTNIKLGEDHYDGGSYNGITKRYSESGQLIEEIPYTNDKKNGVVKWYGYSSGARVLGGETPYTDDKKNGVEKIYYESGEVWRAIPYTDDKINGVEKDYTESGCLYAETTYNNGDYVKNVEYDCP